MAMAGVGIIQLDLSEANQACGEFANKLHFSLSSPLYGTFAALSGFIAEISFSSLGIADLVERCGKDWSLGVRIVGG